LNTNANTNDITGDKLLSKHATQRYRDNYDMIFHHHKKDGQVASLAGVQDTPTSTLEGSQKDSEGKI